MKIKLFFLMTAMSAVLCASHDVVLQLNLLQDQPKKVALNVEKVFEFDHVMFSNNNFNIDHFPSVHFFNVTIKNISDQTVIFDRSAISHSYSKEHIEKELNKKNVAGGIVSVVKAAAASYVLWIVPQMIHFNLGIGCNKSRIEFQLLPSLLLTIPCRIVSIVYAFKTFARSYDLAVVIDAKLNKKNSYYHILDRLMPEHVELKPGEEKKYLIILDVPNKIQDM